MTARVDLVGNKGIKKAISPLLLFKKTKNDIYMLGA